MLPPALILVLHMILMPASRLYASTSRATHDSYASITSLVMDWLIVIIEQGNSLRAALQSISRFLQLNSGRFREVTR
jgi:hypothetical protein